mmetsp:Transcript_3530/g.6967  ORF Transcript_3530/g.6967 Transcript_3530/m.6967 type:complete len:252 (+) Transcript_3530:298-1053(+)
MNNVCGTCWRLVRRRGDLVRLLNQPFGKVPARLLRSRRLSCAVLVIVEATQLIGEVWEGRVDVAWRWSVAGLGSLSAYHSFPMSKASIAILVCALLVSKLAFVFRSDALGINLAFGGGVCMYLGVRSALSEVRNPPQSPTPVAVQPTTSVKINSSAEIQPRPKGGGLWSRDVCAILATITISGCSDNAAHATTRELRELKRTELLAKLRERSDEVLKRAPSEQLNHAAEALTCDMNEVQHAIAESRDSRFP